MKRFGLLVTIAAIAASVPAAAQGSRGGSHGPVTSHGQAGGGSSHGGGTTTTHGGGSSARSGGSTTTHGGGSTANGKGAGGQSGRGTSTASGSTSGSTATGNTASTSTGSSSTTSPTPTNAVAPPNGVSIKISNNPGQLARVSAMLPQGMTLEQASAGFRNQGQFIAALNASKNLGLNFADLQKSMTVDGLSLGQAARQLRTTQTTSEPASGARTTTSSPATTAPPATGTSSTSTGSSTTR